MSTHKYEKRNRKTHTIAKAFVVGIFFFVPWGIFSQECGSLTDFDSHPPPSSGTYIYSPPGDFMPNNTGFPDAGESYVEPVFGSTITRITNSYGSGYRTVGYSGILVINADNSKCLLETYPEGEGRQWQIYALDGSGVIENAPSGFSPLTTNWQWHPTDPDKLLFMTRSAVWEYSVSANASQTIKSFGSGLNNGGEGNFTDRTGRYYAGWVDGRVRFYDRTEDEFYSNEPNIGSFGGGSVRIGPDGSGFITTGNSAKTWWYPVNHNTNTIGSAIELCNSAPHADVMTDSSGVTYYIVSGSNVISVGGQSIENTNNMLAIPVLNPGNYHNSVVLTWGPDVNVSGNIYGIRSNWYCMYTMGQDGWDDNTPWNSWISFREEIFLVNVKTNEVKRIAHHRSRRSGIYQFQPKATVSTDGTLVIFHSNFGRASDNYVDAYVVVTPFACIDEPTSLGVDLNDDGTPPQIKDYKLSQNYPNPFNPATTIKYSLAVGTAHELSLQRVSLIVYDLLGKEVATLVNEQQRPGIYEVTWDASNMPSGVYFYQLRAGNFIQVKKLILLR